ncbi:MAG: alpha/beta hydrolase-fold protein [Planctomycetota bacterium]|nr:alpha/beta hydrolase-fold protein [Planctomycetota bacterium]MDA1248127.1 alpha/beta hydrolase-fold protein [Planctomycetota bacterium]
MSRFRPGMFTPLVVSWLWLTVPATGADLPAPSKLIEHDLESPHQRTKNRIEVLLPDKLEPGRKYRVLYVLPVEAGTTRYWGHAMNEVRTHDLHNRFEVICVYPTFSDLPWFADHPEDGKIAQETYLLKSVVPYIDKNFPTTGKAEDRFLVGFSKSGWGAFSLLLRNPETFARAAAWDAPLMMSRHGQYGSGPIFGTLDNFRKYELTKLVAEAKLNSKTPKLIHLGFDNFREHHEDFEALLQKLKVPHVYRDGPKRKHRWDSQWLPEAVELLLKPPEEKATSGS